MTEQRFAPVSFEQAVEACFENQEFMEQYDRLHGTHLCVHARISKAPIEFATDQACDVAKDLDPQEVKDFFDFVRDYVWRPVNDSVVKEYMEKHEREE